MVLAIWDDGNWERWAIIAGILVAAYLLVMWVAALVWTYRDITARTRDSATQTLSLLMVLFFNIPGLMLYLILRPRETLADQYDRQLEAEALLHELQEQAACPRCRRKVERDFVTCPFCRTALRVACESCGKSMMPSWVACAYCGTSRRDEAPVPLTRPVAAPQPAASASSTPSATPARPRPKRPASTATYTPPAQAVQQPSHQPASDATAVDPGA
jgi:hypothetical protein